jgi:hypothetical protein
MDPAVFRQLLQQGTVQPEQLSADIYQPDYSAMLTPTTTPGAGANDLPDWSASVA